VVMLDTRYSRDDHAIPSVGGSTRLFKPGKSSHKPFCSQALLFATPSFHKPVFSQSSRLIVSTLPTRLEIA